MGVTVPRRNTPFVPEAPRCFLPVGETGVCKRKGGSQGPETQRNCRLRKFRLSFWVEAPWSALRGWPLSNQTNNAARPSSRASKDLVSCLRKGSLRAGLRLRPRERMDVRKNEAHGRRQVLLVRCGLHVVKPGQVSIPVSRVELWINPEVGPCPADECPVSTEAVWKRCAATAMSNTVSLRGGALTLSNQGAAAGG